MPDYLAEDSGEDTFVPEAQKLTDRSRSDVLQYL